MPFYQVIYVLPNQATGFRGGFRCQVCGSEPAWHSGAANKADMPIQLRCDNCLTQCAEFLTEEDRSREIAAIHERAIAYNHDVTFKTPKYHS
jgi:hypothetical protein